MTMQRTLIDRRRNVIDMEVNVATRRFTVVVSTASLQRRIEEALQQLHVDGYESHVERCSVGVAMTLTGGRLGRVEAGRAAAVIRDGVLASTGLRLRVCPF